MSAARRDVYVWYRVTPDRAGAAATAVDALLAALAPHCAEIPRRMTRSDDPTTWMEVYPDVGDTVALLATLDAASGRVAGLVGERHVECFVTPPAD